MKHKIPSVTRILEHAVHAMQLIDKDEDLTVRELRRDVVSTSVSGRTRKVVLAGAIYWGTFTHRGHLIFTSQDA